MKDLSNISIKETEEKVDTPTEDNKEDNFKMKIRRPNVDIYELEKKYIIYLSIPGVKKENINISFKGESQVLIKGVVNLTKPQQYKATIRNEIYQGPFWRKIDLEKVIDKNNVEFNYRGGILEINIPKIGEGGN